MLKFGYIHTRYSYGSLLFCLLLHAVLVLLSGLGLRWMRSLLGCVLELSPTAYSHKQPDGAHSLDCYRAFATPWIAPESLCTEDFLSKRVVYEVEDLEAIT